MSLRKEELDQPNILWISLEDTSPRFGCYGDQIARTPNIDRLAYEGKRYPNAFSTAGVCAPSRSAIITGMYQTSIGTHHIPLFLHHTSIRLLNTCEQPDTIVQTINRRIISLRPLLQLGMSVTIRHIGEIALVILPSFQSLIQQ